MYLGHLASPDLSESEDGVSDVEFAHHDLLNQVLDDSRSKTLFSVLIILGNLFISGHSFVALPRLRIIFNNQLMRKARFTPLNTIIKIRLSILNHEPDNRGHPTIETKQI